MKGPSTAFGKKIVYKHSVGVILTFVFSLLVIALAVGIFFLPYYCVNGTLDEVSSGAFPNGIDFIKYLIGQFTGEEVASMTLLKETVATAINPTNTIVPVAINVYMYFLLFYLLMIVIYTIILVIGTLTLILKGHLKHWKLPYSMSKRIFFFAFDFYAPLILLNVYNAWIKDLLHDTSEKIFLNGIYAYLVMGALLVFTIVIHVFYVKFLRYHVYIKNNEEFERYKEEYEREMGSGVEVAAKKDDEVVEAPKKEEKKPSVIDSIKEDDKKESVLVELPHPVDVKEKPVVKDDSSKYLPKTITTIGGHAFAQNTLLEEANIPEGIDVLGAGAFANCVNLRKVYIPSSVKKIEYNCFFNCLRLEKITYGGTRVMWTKVKRGSNWLLSAGTHIIICQDGSISVDPKK